MKFESRTIIAVVALWVGLAAPVWGQSLGAQQDAVLLRQALQAAPKVDAKRLINESNSFLREREPEMSAEEYALYEKVVTILANNPEFALKLLEAMMNEKEVPSPAFQFILGNAYYAVGQNDKSELNYRAAVKRFPTFLRAWNNLAVLYYMTDRYGEAIQCFSKSVVLGDRDPMTFGLLGYCLEKEGNVVSAEMAYMQALAGDPAGADWKEGLLRIYIQGKQFGRAEPLVKSLIKDQPEQTRFWLAYANILVADQRKLAAVALLEVAASVGVAGIEELSLLGDLYAEHGLLPEALGIYARVLGPARSTGEKRLLHFAKVLIGDKRLDEAQKVLTTLEAGISAERRLEYLQTQADLLAAEKRWADARRILDQLLAESPLNGSALVSLGRAYLAEGNETRARLAFESAAQLSDSMYQASLELANLEIRSRHYEKSIGYLETAQRLQRTDAVADCLARVRTLIAKEL